jgi:two-component system response regulator YesN
MNHLYESAKIPFPGNSEIIKTIHQMNHLYEIIDFFISQIDIVISAIGTTSSDTVIEDVLQYMNHHYTHSIKLEAIAPLFGYNSSYLGKLFSKKVGENFNTHLDHIRIEQAKELLKNQDLKVYTVAENVGYSNVDYFHIKFKKFVGETPAEYRKKYIS